MRDRGRRRGAAWAALVAGLALAGAGAPAGARAAHAPADSVAQAPVADSAAQVAADSARTLWTRAGLWSGGLAGALVLLDPRGVNRRLDVTNLALAAAFPYFHEFREIEGELRYGVSERLSLELRGGYLWHTSESGLFSRRLSAVPLVLGATWYTAVSPRVRVGPTVGGGILWRAHLSGEDPLGGADDTGSGPLAEAGGEIEYFLGPAFSARARGLGRWAWVGGLFPDGGGSHLSGFLAQGALRVYFGR